MAAMGEANEEDVAVRSAGSHATLKRGNWGSKLEFILTCIGYAIGLGNLWRFPMLAYDNGGGAFLVTYICSSVLFGLPMLFLEFAIGQYTHSGPSRVFVKYAPAFQGMGWGMVLVVTAIGVYSSSPGASFTCGSCSSANGVISPLVPIRGILIV